MLWRWEYGRQSGGYSKLLLATSKWLKFDLYFLKLPKGSIVGEHVDPSLPGYEHHRVNIAVRAARRGGVTMIEDHDTVVDLRSYTESARAYHFRPDIQHHYVTKVLDGEIWMLSFGWLRKTK